MDNVYKMEIHISRLLVANKMNKEIEPNLEECKNYSLSDLSLFKTSGLLEYDEENVETFELPVAEFKRFIIELEDKIDSCCEEKENLMIEVKRLVGNKLMPKEEEQ